MVIYVDTSYETCILKAKERNQEQIDSASELEQVYRNRYVKGHKLNMREVNPKELADIILNTD